MKRFLQVALLSLAIPLAACGTVEQVLTAATSTVQNPVGVSQVYEAKQTYLATVKLAVRYREFCYSKPYAQLMADPIAAPACRARRPTIRAIQAARLKAASAVASAERFSQNQSVNAGTAIAAAWDAVRAFQAAVPATP